jgi:Tol biopolymer transport system component
VAACRPAGPQARDILFQATRPGGTEDIYALRVDDLTTRRLVAADSFSSRALPAWSPDGRSIVFTREFGDTAQLYVLGSVGATPRRLAEELHGFFAFPDWSPDGRQILFSAGPDPAHPAVYLIRADGSGLRAVLQDSLAYRCPSWSPDGRRFVVSAYAAGRSRILVVDLGTGARRTLLAPDSAYVDCPQWSPRGDLLLITVYRGTSGLYEGKTRKYGGNLATFDLATGRFTALTDGRGLNNYGHWSRDARWVVFQSDRHVRHLPDSTGAPPMFDSLEIYVVRSDGGGLRRLTTNAYFDAHPSW